MVESILDSGLVLILTTEADLSKAHSLGNKLLKQRLISCVNYTSIESHYWWDDKIQFSKEVQIIIKTKKQNLNLVISFIEKYHSYTTPEIISLPFLTTNNYAHWSLGVMN